MKKTFFALLMVLGVLFTALTIITTFGVVAAYIERTQHGAGLMFADVEILAGLTILFLIASIICFWIASKIKKSSSPEN